MVAANPNDRIPFPEFNTRPPANLLVERIRRYFDRHPEASRDEFWLEALRREIDRREGQGVGRRLLPRPPLSAEDNRFHTWLNKRLAAVHYERHGLWPRLRRLLFGNRLVRWLR